MAFWGKPGAMIMDRCMYTAYKLPLMTFTCNNNYKHNTSTVLSVQACNCAAVQLHEQVNGILEKKFVPVRHES